MVGNNSIFSPRSISEPFTIDAADGPYKPDVVKYIISSHLKVTVILS